MAGCLPFDSMRQSTLTCLYNQSCVDFIALQKEISHPRALNRSLTRFPLDVSIGQLFDEYLFVESWGNESNYEKYYSSCSPRVLSYSYQTRFDWEKMFVLIFAGYGALVILLKIITPIFIQLRADRSSFHLRAHLVQTWTNLNFYPCEDLSEKSLRIFFTRLTIFICSVVILLYGIIVIFSTHTELVTIKSPSMSQFEESSSKLTCPCSRFSMSYNRILSIRTRFHSICSSEYLRESWLAYFGHVEINIDEIQFLATDFRTSGQSFFNLIEILCQTSNETILNALITFGNHRLVTMNVLSFEEFQSELNRRMKIFQDQTIASFVHLIQLIRSSIQINQLAESLWMNVGPYSQLIDGTSRWNLTFRSRDFYTNACSCALSNECIRPVGFYFQNDSIRATPVQKVPGLVLGCFSIDSVLLSTLECFYRKDCVKLLVEFYDFDVKGLVYPLKDSTMRIQPLSNDNSRFSSNTTIREIFEQLFVEEWINSTNYSSYYHRCRPLECTYYIQRRFSLSYVITKLLAFIGGLTALLDVIIPPIIQLVSHVKRRTNPSNSQGKSNMDIRDQFFFDFRWIFQRNVSEIEYIYSGFSELYGTIIDYHNENLHISICINYVSRVSLLRSIDT